MFHPFLCECQRIASCQNTVCQPPKQFLLCVRSRDGSLVNDSVMTAANDSLSFCEWIVRRTKSVASWTMWRTRPSLSTRFTNEYKERSRLSSDSPQFKWAEWDSRQPSSRSPGEWDSRTKRFVWMTLWTTLLFQRAGVSQLATVNWYDPH
jgi:hypothetical protein